MIASEYVAAGAALLVVLAGLAGAMTAATQTGSTVTIETTPTDPNDAEATHTVVFSPSVASVGSTFEDIRINYSVDQPTADVSNVGSGTIERIGIDRGGDTQGTRIDAEATVSEVSDAADGADIQIVTNGELTIEPDDEIVVVMRPVQNPQNAGTADVDAILNTQGTAETATDSVTYEYNSAAVTVSDQSTDGSTVTVDDASLSEPGFVVILNRSGRNPDAVRGATFVEAGDNRTVDVEIEPPVEAQTELSAQVHLDTNGDFRFDYTGSGGETDGPFEDRNGNVMASDSATVWQADRTRTPTPDSGDDDPDISNYEATADGDTITVSFDSDENLVDIEVEVRGPEDATLTSGDFDGDRFEGYEANYSADSEGTYTLELVTAEDSSGNDGADDGDYSDTATVEHADDGSGGDDTPTATPTATPSGRSPQETATPTATSDSATPTETVATGMGTPTATAPPETGTPSDSPTDEDAPGFGAGIALVAVIGSALLFYRRR